MPSVYVKTLGCKVNTYDSNALSTELEALGYEVVDSPDEASITILNTCSVTANADREARHLLRRMRRASPEGLVVATGCYAQTDSARLAAMDEVDLVVPNEAKAQLAALIGERIAARATGETPESKLPRDVREVKENRQGHFKTSLAMQPADSDKTRAFLKIQDGCNGFCTYCLIPYARGASRSVPAAEVLTEVRRQIDAGIQEIVFTGIHIGDYGDDLGHEDGRLFLELIETMYSWPDMVRLRISSLEPRELSKDLLEVLASRRDLSCDHFHLPLQAGHDRILKLMRRTYDTAAYAEKVALAREYFPAANIGADVIPGFPSETDEEFEATMAFIRAIGLNYLHVFPYSQRPNTAAARMPGHLSGDVVKERSRRLRTLSDELKLQFQRQAVGREASVLWEHDLDPAGRRIGRSTNYLEVASHPQAAVLQGTVTRVVLKGLVEGGRLLGVPQ